MKANDYNKITTFEVETKFEEVSTQLTFLRNYMLAFERAWNIDTTYYKTMVESLKSEVDGLCRDFKSMDVAFNNITQAYEEWGGD